MKKIFLIIIICCAWFLTNAQTPFGTPNYKFGTVTKITQNLGGFVPDSGYMIYPRFNDTSSANLSVVSLYGGMVIRIGDTPYLRNQAATQWLKMIGTGGAGGSETWQQTMDNGSTLDKNNSIAGGGFNFVFNNSQFGIPDADSAGTYPTNLLWSNPATGLVERTNSDQFSVNTIYNGCVSGCIVTWDTLYTYIISPSKYYIAGEYYESPADTITLDAADPTNDRIDVFVVNTSSANAVVKGTPANPALQPDIDELTQLQISFAVVSANTTSPTIDTLVLYKENLGQPTEWDYADNSATLNPASTSNPYQGTYDIEGTNVVTSNLFTLTTSTAPDYTTYSMLNFKIRLKSGFANGITIRFQNTNTILGNTITLNNGQYGFVSSNSTSYQNISIPLAAFGNITGANRVRFQKVGATTVGFYVDNIILLSGELPPLLGIQTITATAPITATQTGSSVNIALTTPLAAIYGGTGQSSYTAGDLLYASNSTTLSKLAIGSAGQHLVVSGGLPVWRDTTAVPSSVVNSFSAGTTGFTPSTATTGAVTLAGTLDVDNGGTGQTSYTDGQLLIGNTTGNTLTKSTLTAGSGISITNGSGSITIAATGGGGTVTDFIFTDGNGFDGTVTNSTTTPTLSITSTVSNTQVIYSNSGALTGAAGMTFNGTSTLSLGVAAASTGTINLSGSTSGTVTINPAAAAGTWTLTLPTTGGTSGYYLSTNGSGTTTWTNPTPALTATQIAFGDGSNLMTSSSNLTYASNNVSILGGTIGATTVDGLELTSSETASSGNQKWSPALRWRSFGWSTTNSASRAVDYINYIEPIQGTANPSGKVHWAMQLNNGGYGDFMTYTSVANGGSVTAGTLNIAGTITCGSNSMSSSTNILAANNFAMFSGSTISFTNGSTTNATYSSSGLVTTTTLQGFVFQRGGTQTLHNQFEINENLSAGQSANFTNGTTTCTMTNALEFLKPGDVIAVNSNNYTVQSISGTTVTFTPSFSSATNTYAITTINGGGIVPTLSVSNSGLIRIGGTSWTTQNALIDIAYAGTAYLAPIRFTAGTDLTTGVDGAMNWDGSNMQIWDGTTKYSFVKALSGSATLDFASTGAGAVADLTITVTGAADGDIVMLGVPNGSVTATATYTAWVSAANTVTVRFSPKATEDPASGTFKVLVRQ